MPQHYPSSYNKPPLAAPNMFTIRFIALLLEWPAPSDLVGAWVRDVSPAYLGAQMRGKVLTPPRATGWLWPPAPNAPTTRDIIRTTSLNTAIYCWIATNGYTCDDLFDFTVDAISRSPDFIRAVPNVNWKKNPSLNTRVSIVSELLL